MRICQVWIKTVSAREVARGCRRALATLLLSLSLAGCQTVTAPATFPDGEGTLLVRLSGLRSDTGLAVVSLFAGEKGFPDEVAASLTTVSVPIRAGQAEALFSEVPYGEYAVSVLHDEDGDGKMATGLLGAPREGFGFSGQPDYRFGHPDFAKTSFLLLSPHREIEIRLRYETGRREHQESGQATHTRRPED